MQLYEKQAKSTSNYAGALEATRAVQGHEHPDNLVKNTIKNRFMMISLTLS